MKFSSKEDIDVPIDQVFQMISNFDAIERAALRRGADVERLDKLQQPGVGMRWSAAFKARGRMRELEIEMTAFNPPNQMQFHSVAQGLESDFVVELVEMSRNRTRLGVQLDLRPRSISARLLVQSLKLARTSLNEKFRKRIADYARDLESRAARIG